MAFREEWLIDPGENGGCGTSVLIVGIILALITLLLAAFFVVASGLRWLVT